ncbi:MAG TPA: tlde1 domain-containing protein [Microvirga sp.]|nr:tlde1 domain-containing protein [Microvirga sp.]
MVHYHYSSGRRAKRKNRRGLFLTAALVAISMSPVVFFAKMQFPDRPTGVQASAPSSEPVRMIAALDIMQEHNREIVDPKLTLSAEALSFGQNTPLPTTFKPFAQTHVAAAVPPSSQGQAQLPAPPAEQTVAQTVQPIPLPVPRPAEFRFAKVPEKPRAETPKAARVPAAPAQTASMVQPSAPTNNPSFFEKLFGIKPAAPPENAMSYAAVTPASIAPSSRFDAMPDVDNRTAVYNISAQVVIMPNGERLEAHSGLGDKLDDPRFVHVRMKGPTPPGTYILSEREALFHGVRALRMNPVGGSAAIHGRDGILAHTYMLGPNGDSNGCISFKNYDRFLQAYLKGEVKRIVVVAGTRQDALPRMVNRGRIVPERDT